MQDYIIYVSFFNESKKIIDVQCYSCLEPQADFVEANIDDVVNRHQSVYTYDQEISWEITDSEGFESLAPHTVERITPKTCIEWAKGLSLYGDAFYDFISEDNSRTLEDYEQR